MLNTKLIALGLITVISSCTSNSFKNRVPASAINDDNICFAAAKNNLRTWGNIHSFNNDILTKPYSFDESYFDAAKDLKFFKRSEDGEVYGFSDGKKIEIKRNSKGQISRIRSFHYKEGSSATDLHLSWSGDKCQPEVLSEDIKRSVKSGKKFVANPTWSYSFESCSEVVDLVGNTMLEKKMSKLDGVELDREISSLYYKVDKYFEIDLKKLENIYGKEVRDIDHIFSKRPSNQDFYAGALDKTRIAKYRRVSEIKKELSRNEENSRGNYKISLKQFDEMKDEKYYPSNTHFPITSKEAFEVVQDTFMRCRQLLNVYSGSVTSDFLELYRSNLKGSATKTTSESINSTQSVIQQ